MRSTFRFLFYKSPFENLKRHADKAHECARMFEKAMECYLDNRCEEFDELTDQVARIESEADAIKRNIRGHMPRSIFMPVDKFQFHFYLREQDSVLDRIEEALYWLSYRPEAIEGDLAEDLVYLVHSVIPAVEKLSPMADLATHYFRTGYEETRKKIKGLIIDIRQHEHEADHLERELKHKIFSKVQDPLSVFRLIRLVETIGSVADKAQNAADFMRAMISK